VETPGIIQPRQVLEARDAFPHLLAKNAASGGAVFDKVFPIKDKDGKDRFSLVLFKADESWEAVWDARWGKRKAISLSIGAYTLRKGKDDRQVDAATDAIDKMLVTDDEDAINKMLVTDDDVEDAEEGAVKDAVKDDPAPDVRNTYIKYLTKHCETNLPPCLAIKRDDSWRANPANCGPRRQGGVRRGCRSQNCLRQGQGRPRGNQGGDQSGQKSCHEGPKGSDQGNNPEEIAKTDGGGYQRRKEEEGIGLGKQQLGREEPLEEAGNHHQAGYPRAIGSKGQAHDGQARYCCTRNWKINNIIFYIYFVHPRKLFQKQFLAYTLRGLARANACDMSSPAEKCLD
jgi:hypothetical protein